MSYRCGLHRWARASRRDRRRTGLRAAPGARRRPAAGARAAVTVFGTRRDGAGSLVTAVLQRGEGGLELLRTSVDPAVGYHALTASSPRCTRSSASCTSRPGCDHRAPVAEARPLRGRDPGRDELRIPFYQLEGKEVHEVEVGPIHAGVIEPGAFRFMCLGEHRPPPRDPPGLPAPRRRGAAAARRPARARRSCETIAGDTSVAHAWAYCAALEALAGGGALDPREVESRSARARAAIALELERVAMHLAGLAGLAADVGFLQGASTYGRLRTTAINTSMRLCGSRFGRGAIRPGGQPHARRRRGWPRSCATNLALLRRRPRHHQRLLPRRRARSCAPAARGRLRHRRAGAGARAGRDGGARLGVGARRAAARARRLRRAPIDAVCVEPDGRLLGARPAAHPRDRRARSRGLTARVDAIGGPPRPSSPVGALAPEQLAIAWARAGAARSCTAPGDRRGGAPRALQGPRSVAAQLVRASRSPCAATRSPTSPSATRASTSPTAGTTCEPSRSTLRGFVLSGRAVHRGPAHGRARGLPRAAGAIAAPRAQPAGTRASTAPRPRPSPRPGAPSTWARCVFCGECARACPGGQDHVDDRDRAWPPPRATTSSCTEGRRGDAAPAIDRRRRDSQAVRAIAQAAPGLGRRLQRLRAGAERARQRQLRPATLRHRVGRVAAPRRRPDR